MDITGIDYMGIDRVLKRGTGEVIERHDKALFVYDDVSGAFLLGCEDAGLGDSILARHVDQDCHLLMVSDHRLGKAAFKQYGFSGMLECHQTAYYGEKPDDTAGIAIKTARIEDLPLLIATYDLVSPTEMRKIVERQSLLLGYDREQLVGFIGEHLEGSMGLLYIFPQYRRRGYAIALEKACIAKTLEKGYIPFGQVEKNNLASLKLQKKLGMTVSENLICWMWR